jgi:hypothetical protein
MTKANDIIRILESKWELFDIQRNRTQMLNYEATSYGVDATDLDKYTWDEVLEVLEENLVELEDKLQGYKSDPSWGDKSDSKSLQLKAQVKATKTAISKAKAQLKKFKKTKKSG